VALVVTAKQVLKGIATSVAVTAATITGGPAAGASLAAYLASPVGQRVLDSAIEESARANNVQIEDLAKGGLVMSPTLGLTGEAGPELVIPVKAPKKRSRSARAADKKLSKAFKEANRRYRTKNGSLRKGRTQADIARLAHRLRKKM
jgi:hypothetical protein